ncbi:DNA polymerase sliding clamp subunit (PCNA homolog) [Butyrivibrio fibrisolvens 16/4]|nr:DNA polymerase sliding clamp subunit (PCNA homolog) [Butyrivibrio fibrisolvens 16/4]
MSLSISSHIGSMNEDIDIVKEGKDIMIGFNPKFVMDALKVIDDEEINLYMLNAKSPCFIKDDEGSFIYIVLPVNFNNPGAN